MITRRVLRNRRLQTIGAVSSIFGLGMLFVAIIVIRSPSQSIDNPGGFTSGGRALTLAGCLLAAIALLVMGAASLRVALIVDETGLVIRNPLRTTTVPWASSPHFDVRNRRQEVAVQSPITGMAQPKGQIVYKYRELVCVVNRQHIWIAATSRMTDKAAVDELLGDLRAASGRH